MDVKRRSSKLTGNVIHKLILGQKEYGTLELGECEQGERERGGEFDLHYNKR